MLFAELRVISDSPDQKKSLLKSPYFYSSCVVLFVLLYVGWTFFSRWQQNRSIQRRVREERAERQREQDRAAIEQLGGSELAIQSFYVSPGVIRRGQSVQICYGVANASTVTLDPPVAKVWPSYSRCFDVTPSHTTIYTLTIAGASGETRSATITVKVQ
jgi:hypothetical protein